jgi:hypothetical protein
MSNFKGFSCTFATLGALLPSVAGPLIVSDPNVHSVDPFRIKSEIQTYLLICKIHCFISIFNYISRNAIKIRLKNLARTFLL